MESVLPHRRATVTRGGSAGRATNAVVTESATTASCVSVKTGGLVLIARPRLVIQTVQETQCVLEPSASVQGNGQDFLIVSLQFVARNVSTESVPLLGFARAPGSGPVPSAATAPKTSTTTVLTVRGTGQARRLHVLTALGTSTRTALPVQVTGNVPKRGVLTVLQNSMIR